jgi:uncharacterized protein (TIGR03083 family)
MTRNATDPAPWLTALDGSHERLRRLVEPLGPQEVRERAYPSEWSIARVLSHLGSTAEIFGLFLDAGLSGEGAPGVEQFRPVGEVWKAKSPEEQVADGVAADGLLTQRLVSLDPGQRRRWRLAMFGDDTVLAGLLRMRLSEHAVHSWDVAVALDPAATVAPDAVSLLVGELGPLARHSGQPHEPVRLHVHTTDPEREFLLDLGGTDDLRPWDDGPEDGGLTLPAEALLRLVYGRLDADHAPAVTAVNVDLEDLRKTFIGV